MIKKEKKEILYLIKFKREPNSFLRVIREQKNVIYCERVISKQPIITKPHEY